MSLFRKKEIKDSVNLCRKIRKSVMQDTLDYLKQVKEEMLKTETLKPVKS